MQYFNLDVYQYHKLSEEKRKVIDQTNESINQCIQVENYKEALEVLEEAAIRLQELGIYSSIYYRISSMKNRVFDMGKSLKEIRSKKRLFDVYQECYDQKDYRNAVRMLRYYEACGEDELNIVPLHLAKVYIKLGDFKKTEHYLEECQKTQFDNPLYTIILLELFYKKKKYDALIQLLPDLEHYDGRNNWPEYILIAKAFLQLGKREEAEQLYDIAREIAHGKASALRKIEESRTSIHNEKVRHYPTKSNLSILFQIACDEEKIEEAEFYLTELLKRLGEEEQTELDQQKIKKLGELKEKYKEVNSN